MPCLGQPRLPSGHVMDSMEATRILSTLIWSLFAKSATAICTTGCRFGSGVDPAGMSALPSMRPVVGTGVCGKTCLGTFVSVGESETSCSWMVVAGGAAEAADSNRRGCTASGPPTRGWGSRCRWPASGH